MKIWATLLNIGLIGSVALAQTDSESIYAATKKDVISNAVPSGDSGASLMPLIQMALAVTVVVFLLKSFMPKIAKKLNKSLSTKTGSDIRIEETANFAGGTLYIVQAKSKTLLISVNGSGVNCLADLTEDKPKKTPTTFYEVLEAASAAPEKDAAPTAVAYLSEEPETVEESDLAPAQDVVAALERLNRIAK